MRDFDNKQALICLIGAVALAGCASTPKFVGRPGLTYVTEKELPAPVAKDFIDKRTYVIGPMDRLAVDVYGVPELQKVVQVNTGGIVSLPLAGDIDAAGLSSTELARAVEARLRQRYMRDPHVTVNVDAIGQIVSVEGEVRLPGRIPVTNKMTLLRAIAAAQGTTEFAANDYVVIFRQVNGEQMAALYSIRAIRTGAYADPAVYANDVIHVGESRARRVFKDVISTAPLFSAPLVALVR